MSVVSVNEVQKFQPLLDEVRSTLAEMSDNIYTKGDYLGFYVNRLVRKYLGDPNYAANAFNSAHFAEAKKKVLSSAADRLASLLNTADPIAAAAELDYIILTSMRTFVSPQFAGWFGVQAYVEGCLDRIKSHLEPISLSGAQQKDLLLMHRRAILLRGVLSHVIRQLNYDPVAVAGDGPNKGVI